jgi:hypothetical protein
VFYIARDPFPGFAGPLVNIGIVTLGYTFQAVIVYMRLYGRRSHPLEKRPDRMRTTGMIVRVCVYSCIACIVFLSLAFSLALLDQQRWEPFAQSVFLVICALLCSVGLSAPARRTAAQAGV